MDRQKLNGFIDKYSLGGNVESVKWIVSEKDMRTNFVSDDKTLLGDVKYKGIGFREGEYCVYTTSQFKKLINVLDTDIDITVYIVPNAQTLGDEHTIMKELTVNATDTFAFGSERILLGAGDTVQAFASTTNKISVVISYTGI